MSLDVVCKSLCGHADSVFVHTVRADTHDSSKSTGTEFQIAVKSIFKPGRVAVSEFNDFALCLRIKISVKPTLGNFSKIFCHNYMI